MNTRYAKAALVAFSMLLLWSVFPAASASRGDRGRAEVPALPAQAATLECGSLLSGTISAASEVDQITLSGQANQKVTLTLSASDFPVFQTATATLFSPTAVVVGTFSANTQQQLMLPETGTYVIQIRASNLASTGSYSIGLECLLPTSPVDATLACGTLLSDRRITASAQVDQITFSGQANQKLTLTLTAGGFPVFQTATATLFSPTGMEVVTFSANTQQQLTLTETGTYVIQIRASNLASTGSYSIGLECLLPTSPVDATLTCGTLLSSRPISDSAQVDQITFSGQANQKLTLTLTAGGFPVFQTATATLFSPTGMEVVTFSANTQQQLTLTECGTYVIQVRASNLVSAGTYSIGLQCLPPILPALTLNPLTITAGTSGNMTVTINTAQATDTLVTLSSSNTAAAIVPSSVTIPANATSTTFTVMGIAIGMATITATPPSSFGGCVATAPITVVAPTGLAPTCAITPSGPFTVNAGTPVSFVVTGTDLDAGAMLTLNTGGLPQGATMTPSLPVTGPSGVSSTFNWTPTTASNNVVTFSVTDETSRQSLCSATINVVVPCPAITVNPPTIPAGITGQPYSQTFTQTGGTGSVTFSLTGALPAGLDFTPAGVLSGTPTASGSFPITIKATDQNDCMGTRAYTLVINNPAPSLSSLSPSSATAGGATFTLTVNGANFVSNSKVQWNGSERATTFVSPTQLTAAITAADIAAPDTANVTVLNPTPGGGVSNPLPFMINASVECPAITVNPPTIPAGITGQPYSQTFTQTGGTGSVTFSLTGALPAGLDFTPAGVLSGTPTASGSFPITIKATDQNNCMATRAYTLVIHRVTFSVTDPLACTGPNNTVTGTFTITNNGAAALAVTTANVALPSGLVGIPGSGSSNLGTVSVTAGAVTLTGVTLAPNQTVTVSYLAQVGDSVPSGTSLCSSLTVALDGVTPLTIPACVAVNCSTGGPVGPGASFPAASEVSDQKAGSVLVYNLYSSNAAAPNTQNARISITNTNPSLSIAVHLFFVDGQTCSIADAIICLTQNQTASFLASDLDPGTTGYIVAVASDPTTGCPVNFNFLIGDEYVKLASGHQANLGAEAFSALAGGLPGCDGNAVTATLNFDGVSYNRVPRTLAASSIPARADGNDTLLIINRFGGNLAIGAATLTDLFGIFYDDAENGMSFTFSPGTCQFRSSLSSNFPRTTPRLETFIPAGRSGWLRLYSTSDLGLLGAVLNFNPNATTNAGAFNQGRNLHKLTLTATQTLVIPIFPPNCLD